MTSKDNEAAEHTENTDLDKKDKKRATLKATLIGFACGVMFMLAAKMVSIALG